MTKGIEATVYERIDQSITGQILSDWITCATRKAASGTRVRVVNINAPEPDALVSSET
jgi:hypothetical protein